MKSQHPAPPKKRSTRKVRRKPPKLPSKDADFAELDATQAYQTELGIDSLQPPSRRHGVEAARYAADRQSHIEVQTRIRKRRRCQQRVSCLGDGTKEPQLVKCGLRWKMKTAAIIQGPLAANVGATAPCETKYDTKYELIVIVDLATGNLTFQGGGKTVKAKLNRPMKRITHVGYCLKETVTDFSPIEVSTAQ